MRSWEALDFTFIDGARKTSGDLPPIFGGMGEWRQRGGGIEFVVDTTSFRPRRNRRGNSTAQGRIAYRGPNEPPQLPKVKLDITSHEVLVDQPERRLIGPHYSDAPLPGDTPTRSSLAPPLRETLHAHPA